MLKAERFLQRPIITPDTDDSLGGNINGPSLIRAPDWLENALGRYYLYFAHHQGEFIRLAYADRLEGPWKIYRPGTLQLEGSGAIHTRARQLRDPGIYEENDETYLLYSVAGESGIAMAKVSGFQEGE